VLRPRIESALCVLFATLTGLTVLWPTWIEGLTGLEPDGGDGTMEWLIVFAFGVVAVVFGLLARRDYRLATLSTVSASAAGTDGRSTK
jgi:hypothetical protein